MATKSKYRQCKLERPVDGNAVEQTHSWIPEQYAVVGMSLCLRDGSDWSNGWIVVSASSEALDEAVVLNMSRAYLKQRKSSDI